MGPHSASGRGPNRGWWSALALLCCFTGPGLVEAEELSWKSLANGLEMAVWKPGPLCDYQVAPFVVLKVDPERFRFAVYHYQDEGLPAPLTIQDWQGQTGASVLFNAGLFREDYSYLGLLFKNGRSLGSKQHPHWKGLFVAEPVVPGMRKARVVDLAAESFSDQKPVYREVAQSLMLLDGTGRPRVRQSGQRAHQTVVAEGRSGDAIFVMKTTEAVGLWELADCLKKGFPLIHQAMAMDGGASSDLLVGAELVAAHRGSEEAFLWQGFVTGGGTPHIRLPSVIGILPR